jgi:hypothetical protein
MGGSRPASSSKSRSDRQPFMQRGRKLGHIGIHQLEVAVTFQKASADGLRRFRSRWRNKIPHYVISVCAYALEVKLQLCSALPHSPGPTAPQPADH